MVNVSYIYKTPRLVFDRTVVHHGLAILIGKISYSRSDCCDLVSKELHKEMMKITFSSLLLWVLCEEKAV